MDSCIIKEGIFEFFCNRLLIKEEKEDSEIVAIC